MFLVNSKSVFLFTLIGTTFIAGCGGARLRARQEQREKLVSSSGIFCEWVNTEKHSDFDVEVNLQMGKRCEATKTFSIIPFKNNSDQNGVMYCCGVAGYEGTSAGNYAPQQNYYAPPPRRAAGPAVRRVAPPTQAAQQPPPPVQQAPPPQMQQAPQQMAAPPAQAQLVPLQYAPPVNAPNDAPDLSGEIVEDK